MKKLVIAMVAVLLVAALAISIPQISAKSDTAAAAAAQTAETAEAEKTETTETAQTETAAAESVDAVSEDDVVTVYSSAYVDYDALYAAYDPDEIAVTINGHEVTWDEYYTWISYYTENLEYYMQMYAMYGYTMSWSDVIDDETGTTCADEAVSTSLQFVEQIYNTLDYAEANGYLTDDVYAELEEDEQAKIAELIESGTLEEGAGEEEFEAYLRENHSSLTQYNAIALFGIITDRIYIDLYGENSELVTDEQALEYYNENSYIYANHILFLNTDSSTGEALSDADLEAILAKAQEISDELNAIEDDEERAARFLELKEEYDEDTGKEYYPNGYIFGLGEMVDEFDSAARALAVYEVSAPVESSYGYHIIMRMPDDMDAVVTSEDASTRELAGSALFNDLMDEIMAANEAKLTPACESFSLLDYLA